MSKSFEGLTGAQIVSKTATMGLTEAQQLLLAQTFATNAAELQNITSLASLTTAEAGTAVVTTGLSAAFKGLWTVLKTNPILLVIGALTVGITIYKKFKQTQEEMHQSAQDAATTAQKQAENLSSLLNRYNDLSKAVQLNQGSKEDLIKVQDDLLSALGIEEAQLDKLVDKYGDLDTAINQVTLDALQEAKGNLLVGVDIAKSGLINTGGESNVVKNDLYIGDDYSEIIEFIKSLDLNDLELRYGGHTSKDTYLGVLADTFTIDGIKQYKKSLEDLSVELEHFYASQGRTEELSSLEFYKGLTAEIGSLSDAYQNYNSALFNYNNNQGQIQVLSSLQGNEIPETKEGFETLKQEIIDTAIASGEFIGTQEEISDTITNTMAKMPEFAKYIENLRNTVENVNLGHITKSNAIAKVNRLSEGFDSLDKIMSSVKDKDNPFDYTLLDDAKFKEIFQILGDSYTDFMETISNSPNDITSCQNAFDNLVTSFLKQKQITDILDDSTKKLVTSMLEDMGVANADMLVHNALATKKAEAAWATQDLSHVTTDEILSLAQEAGVTEDATGAFAAYIVQKMMAEASIDTTGDISALANIVGSLGIATSAWEKYYATKARMAEISADPDYKSIDEYGNVISKEQVLKDYANLAALHQQQYAEEIETKFQKATYSNGTKTNQPSSGGGKSLQESAPTKKEYNWIQRANDLLEKQHQKLQDALGDETVSYSTQIAAIDQLMEKDKQRLDFARQSAKAYEAQWLIAFQKIMDEAARQGLNGEDIISKIKGGSISQNDIAEMYQGDLAGFIDGGISAYDQSAEYASKQKDLEQEIEEHLRNQYEIRLAIVCAQADAVKSSIDMLQAEMDLIEAEGGVVTEAQLRDMIGLYEDQQQAYEDQIHTLRDQREVVEVDSAEYYSLTASIHDCESSILQCQLQQAKLNEEILNLPIRKIERYLELLKNIKQDLSNFMDEQSALGIHPGMEEYQQLIDISQKQIDKLLEQQEELKNKLSHYSFGSDKFNEVQMEIQDIDDEISGLIQSQYEWNQSLLQIPIDHIQEVTGQLSSVADALDDITSEYDTVISAVTSSIDEEMEKMNEKKEATEESYQSEIDAVQEKIDALQKEKEETDLVLKEEKARASFEKAQSQKTNKVLKHGTWEYEADLDQVRDTKKELDDVLLEKQVSGLEQQIQVLEEERDALLETFDSQIGKLQEIQDKWSQITEEIKLAQETAKAEEILGTGWLDQILSGKDDNIFSSFKDQYETMEAQKELYQKQIEANNRLSDLMEKYITAWQSGTLTYDEVISSFDRLMKDMKDGLSSMDHLDAILELVGNGGLSSSLGGMKEELTSSFDQLKEYTEAAQKNFEALSKYTVTWEEMKDAILKQLELLEKLAAEEAEKPNRRPSFGGGGGGGGKNHSNSGSGGKYEGPGYIDAVEKGDKDAVDSWNSGNHGGASSSTIDRIDKELGNRHKGMEDGLIGSKGDHSREVLLKKLSTTDLKPNEVLIKALEGEAVFTEEQQRTLLENLKPVPRLSYRNLIPSSQPFQFLRKSGPGLPSVTMGDIVLQGVQDPDGFAKALKRQIRPAMMQAAYKRF